MAEITVADLEELKHDLEALGKQMPSVASRAINKAMQGTKTDVKAIIRAAYNIKAGALDKRMVIAKVSPRNLNGNVTSSGGGLHLTDIANTREGARGVIVNVKKDTGNQLIPRAFIAADSGRRMASTGETYMRSGGGSGKTMVLRRPGKPRGQHANLWGRYGPPGSGGKAGSSARLDAFYGPHPEVIMNAPENWAKIQTAAATRLDTNITREIDAEFRRLEGKW